MRSLPVATTLTVFLTCVYHRTHVITAASAFAADTVCKLPASALYLSSHASRASKSTGSAVSDDNERYTACLEEDTGEINSLCQTACTCRKLFSDDNIYGVCLSTTKEFACTATDCSAYTLNASGDSTMDLSATPFLRTYNSDSKSVGSDESELSPTPIDTADGDDNDNDNGLETWVWIVCGVGIALLLGLIIFLVNWFKNRPTKGNNQLAIRRAQATTSSTAGNTTAHRESNVSVRSRDTNPSAISGLAGTSYHNYVPSAGVHQHHTLVDTELELRRNPQETMFSPMSHVSESSASSKFSQGVDNDDLTLRGHGQRLLDETNGSSRLSHSLSSYLDDSFTSMDESEAELPPRKKSIEF